MASALTLCRPAVGMRNISFDGHTLLVMAPVNDEYVGADLLQGRPMHPDTLGEMLFYIKPGTTVVDAGW